MDTDKRLLGALRETTLALVNCVSYATFNEIDCASFRNAKKVIEKAREVLKEYMTESA